MADFRSSLARITCNRHRSFSFSLSQLSDEPLEPVTFGGTSVAAPFVTGAVALLWSEFPVAPAAELLLAVRGTRTSSRVAIVPPLLDAWSAHQFMLGNRILHS
jgi:hypothetical protein